MFYLGLIALKLLGWVLALIPRPLFLPAGRAFGSLFAWLGFRRSVVDENLRRAFPEMSEAGREALARASYSQLGTLFLEILRSFYRFGDFYRRRVRVEGREHVRAALAEGKGIFVMTAHLGNWELLAVAGREEFCTSVTMVTKRLKPAWLHRVVEVTRDLMGVRMACEPRTMADILRALKRKEIVGFVMDQYAGAPVGARVPFFGVPVGSQTALAALVLRTGAPVVPALAIRQGDGRFVLRFEPALRWETDPDPEHAILRNTAAYVGKTEEWVREFPEQWMWIHRRWKGDLSPLPPGVIGEKL